jgi:hypothetical protein
MAKREWATQLCSGPDLADILEQHSLCGWQVFQVIHVSIQDDGYYRVISFIDRDTKVYDE